MMKLPDFLGIGAMRCGTTTLWDLLAQDPRIFMPAQKELHFFDNRDGFWEQGFGAYAQLFSAARSDQVCGEVTPCYLFFEEACERIYQVVPGAALVAILRDPVSRARSHYWYSVRAGYERLEFRRALDAEPRRLATATYAARNRFGYVARGRYAEQLQRFADRFGRDRLCVIFLEELRAQPEAVMEQVYRHIGLQPRPLGLEGGGELAQENQGSAHPRSLWVHWLVQSCFRGSLAGPRILHRLANAARRTDKRFNSRPGIPALPADIRARLEAEYRGPNQELEKFLGRPLPWRQG
jgi:hypothetical protein